MRERSGRFARVRRFALVAPIALAVPVSLVRAADDATPPPAWMRLRAGVIARVDVAPWVAGDEPEAALTSGIASARRDFTADAARPDDVAYEPIGVRVRVVRVLPGGVVLVHGAPGRWQAYAPVARLVPDVPYGARLRVAGGFGGATDFFPTLTTTVANARPIETGADLVADRVVAAPYDAQTADLVRVRVRVTSGASRGRSGYVAVVYTGVPGTAPHATITERACRCRLTVFDER